MLSDRWNGPIAENYDARECEREPPYEPAAGIGCGWLDGTPCIELVEEDGYGGSGDTGESTGGVAWKPLGGWGEVDMRRPWIWEGEIPPPSWLPGLVAGGGEVAVSAAASSSSSAPSAMSPRPSVADGPEPLKELEGVGTGARRGSIEIWSIFSSNVASWCVMSGGLKVPNMMPP